MRKFTVDASKKVKATSRNRAIRAAEDFEDPRFDQIEELQDKVEDDFGYVIAGIERLGREGLLDDAIELLNTLAGTLDSAVGIIGDKFDNNSDINKEL